MQKKQPFLPWKCWNHTENKFTEWTNWFSPCVVWLVMMTANSDCTGAGFKTAKTNSKSLNVLYCMQVLQEQSTSSYKGKHKGKVFKSLINSRKYLWLKQGTSLPEENLSYLQILKVWMLRFLMIVKHSNKLKKKGKCWCSESRIREKTYLKVSKICDVPWQK